MTWQKCVKSCEDFKDIGDYKGFLSTILGKLMCES